MNVSDAVIYVVEDDASFRKSIQRLVRGWGYEVLAFESASAYLAQTSIRYPGCLLLDLQLPDIDGLSLQQQLIEKGNLLPVIFMTGHGSIPTGIQAMKNGAIDFLPKPFKAEELLSAIDRALERNLHDIQAALENKKIRAMIDTLTPREKEVLRWLITGMLNKQIAYVLGTTERTIKAHRSHVLQKAKVSSIAELVRLAEKAGIAPAE